MKGAENIKTARVYQIREGKRAYFILLFLFSICLNQTSIIYGFNFSLSDLFVIGLLILLLYQGIRIPPYHLLFFLLLSAVLIATASFYTPFYFHVSAGITAIFKDYIKVLVSFMYFLIGYNLVHRKLLTHTLKWYSCFAVVVGTIGIVTSIIRIPILNSILYFGNVRYRGFMNDPNFFAIVQISSLPFFLKSDRLSFTSKMIIYGIIMVSTILSGSKTGMITLIIYSLFFILGETFKKVINVNGVLFFLFMGGIFCTLFFLIVQFHILDKVDFLNHSFQMKRISLLFTDFNSAVNDGGSSRLSVWQTGLDIIQLSPLIGVGVGMYSEVSERISGISQVAHNTYIQFFSEWGGIFASFFFIYLILLVIKVTFSKRLNLHPVSLVLRDILIIILIGSLAISLNNARVFWFFIGALACLANLLDPSDVKDNSQEEQEKIIEKEHHLMEGST